MIDCAALRVLEFHRLRRVSPDDRGAGDLNRDGLLDAGDGLGDHYAALHRVHGADQSADAILLPVFALLFLRLLDVRVLHDHGG